MVPLRKKYQSMVLQSPVNYTAAPKYLDGDYFKAEVFTIWVHGPFGVMCGVTVSVRSDQSGKASRAYSCIEGPG